VTEGAPRWMGFVEKRWFAEMDFPCRAVDRGIYLPALSPPGTAIGWVTSERRTGSAHGQCDQVASQKDSQAQVQEAAEAYTLPAPVTPEGESPPANRPGKIFPGPPAGVFFWQGSH
jgi:hypothetical protein